MTGRVTRLAGLRLGLLGLVALTIAACTEGPVVQPSEWTDGPGYRYRELAVRGEGPGFQSVAESGLDFVNRLTDAGIVQNRHRMNGSGVAVGDVDGDGRPDVFFAAMESRPSLYRNLGDWRFEDATTAAGLASVPNYSTGAVFADVDGDADLDLFVTALTAPNQLWLNDGAGMFSLADAGLGSSRGSMSAAFADTDGDGDLDLYVANYKRIAARDSLSPDRLLFDALVGPDGQVIPEMRDHYRIEERDGRPLRLELGEEDQYYLNRGDGTFESAPIPGVGRDWGLGVRMQDLSGDGVPDLYVANDFESPDYFLLGDGRGGWLPATPVVGHSPNSSMSVAAADVDHNGLLDLFVPDMRSPDALRSRFQAGTAAPPGPTGVPQYMQNALYLGERDSHGSPHYADAAWAWGVAATEWSWSGLFLDVDLDGWDDLLVSTGHSYDVQDVDAQAREREAIRRVRSVDGFRRLILDYPTLDLPNGAYRNVGGTRFEVVQDGWGIGAEADITHGMALGDFDGDGDLDLVTNRLNQPAGLFENTSAEPRIAIRLVDGGVAAPGHGVRVSVGTSPQESLVGGQYLSSNEPLLVFAAPKDSLQVSFLGRDKRWGYVMAKPNRLYEISDIPLGEDIFHIDPATAKPPGPRPELVQLRATSGYRGDPGSANQGHPLIPRPLGAGRPLAAGDLNGDGQDELVIGGTFTEPGTVRGAEYTLPASPVTWSDAAIADGRVITTVSGPTGSVRLQVLEPGRIVQDLTLDQTLAARLAVADVDGDGIQDAFVGARGLADRYPETEPSTLFFGSSEGLTPRASIEAGMVTGAAFGDVDGDADPDLAVSTDWGPVRLFINTNGTLTEQTESWGLSGASGLWQDVAWGDIDGDGWPDLVASNWGWNSRYGRIGAPDTPDQQLRLYYDDHDGDGRPDPVEAEYRPDLEAWSPITDFNTLRSALPLLARRISTWHAYAEASIEKLFGARTAIKEVNTLATTVFFNRGDRFEAINLPEIAQRAPGQGVVVADMDGNGQAEIILAQNVYDFNLAGTARQDAGAGLIISWTDGEWTHRSLALRGDQDHVVVWRGNPVVSLRDGSVYRIPRN